MVGIGHVYGIAVRTTSGALIFDGCLMVGYLTTLALLATLISRTYSELAHLLIKSLRIQPFKEAKNET